MALESEVGPASSLQDAGDSVGGVTVRFVDVRIMHGVPLNYQKVSDQSNVGGKAVSVYKESSEKNISLTYSHIHTLSASERDKFSLQC